MFSPSRLAETRPELIKNSVDLALDQTNNADDAIYLLLEIYSQQSQNRNRGCMDTWCLNPKLMLLKYHLLNI